MVILYFVIRVNLGTVPYGTYLAFFERISKNVKILITGAHFTPAVAVIEELKKKADKIEIVCVGRSTTLEGDPTPSVESQVLPQLGVKFIPITTGRIQRSFTPYTIPSILKIPIGFIQALYIILSERPDVILSFGGYVAVPVVVVGWLFSIPIIIHEQTLVSGLAHRISRLFADKVALSFDEKVKSRKKTILTGNPIRKEILDSNFLYVQQIVSLEYLKVFKFSKEKKLPVILITGGNQGSHVINLAVEEYLDNLLKVACVIHTTGDNKFHDFERLKIRQQSNYLVKKWIGDEWSVVLSKVDLVVSRAGINTLVELAYLGKPALVIPLPYLYSDEQNKNAKFFEQLGLVKILLQSKLSGKSLIENVKFLLNNLNHLKKNAKKAKDIIIPDAAQRLAQETILLATGS